MTASTHVPVPAHPADVWWRRDSHSPWRRIACYQIAGHSVTRNLTSLAPLSDGADAAQANTVAQHQLLFGEGELHKGSSPPPD